MSHIEDVVQAIAADDLALAEKIIDSISDPRELMRLSNDMAIACQYEWADELRDHADALRQGLPSPPFRFFPEGDRL